MDDKARRIEVPEVDKAALRAGTAAAGARNRRAAEAMIHRRRMRQRDGGRPRAAAPPS